MDEKSAIVEMTTDIVSAYVGANTVSPADLPSLIQGVHRALASVNEVQADVKTAPSEPAVAVKKSITPDYLICLEDGRRFKSLKRHLRSKYDMSPDDYRTKWGLAKDYPMVAPSYARARSALAKQMGPRAGRQKSALRLCLSMPPSLGDVFSAVFSLRDKELVILQPKARLAFRES